MRRSETHAHLLAAFCAMFFIGLSACNYYIRDIGRAMVFLLASIVLIVRIQTGILYLATVHYRAWHIFFLKWRHESRAWERKKK